MTMPTAMTAPRPGLRRGILVLGLGAVLCGLAAAPALADPRHDHDWYVRHHYHWDGARWVLGPVVVAPAPGYYAAPPVYYAPPPPVYYAPPPPPPVVYAPPAFGLNVVVPLRLR